jgi:hypothetical protein
MFETSNQFFIFGVGIQYLRFSNEYLGFYDLYLGSNLRYFGFLFEFDSRPFGYLGFGNSGREDLPSILNGIYCSPRKELCKIYPSSKSFLSFNKELVFMELPRRWGYDILPIGKVFIGDESHACR